MKKIYNKVQLKSKIATIILLLSFFAIDVMKSQEVPFNCDYNAYLFQYSDVYAIDLASGRSNLVAENITEGKVNATAYNPKDGHIWGAVTQPSQSIIRIGKNFTAEIHTIPELPNVNKYVGDINNDGIFYMKAGGTTYYSVDLNPDSATYLKYLSSHTLSTNINIHDWAFNAVDGKLYTVEKNSNKLYRITASTGVVECLGEVPIISGQTYTYGAVYFDASGNFYISSNQSGAIYIINEVDTIVTSVTKSNIFAYGPASASNDGARCPTAPVLQEDCSNGRDDDGDGLIDCADPACSAVQSCPDSYATSSADKGGLESNNRLANLISKRNYNRAKRNYVFDTRTAPRVKKTALYKKNGKFAVAAIPLSTLVPLGVIGESEVIESSPTDLLELTNASDIYSVDYLLNNENIGALMVIKTDATVYEHSKFICDRFLGAELLSVSTVQLRENNFIKSIIRQADGSQEFALTFSARLDKEDNFIIESHWNIDSYAPNTSFYNFQIWSSSLDDLLLLGEEILDLLELNAPISTYESSVPPPVFVKRAIYENGKVQLQLVNNNNSESISIEGGLKRTETGNSELIKMQITLDGYIDSVEVNSGALFDFGFRITTENGDTPDNLFVADAPWGVDNSETSTTTEIYTVLQDTEPYVNEGYRLERNIHLKGKTSTYIGVYRALSPRFKAVDLSAYSKLSFEASGTGALEVKLLNGDGSTFSYDVNLNQERKTYSIDAADFKNQATSNIDFSNIMVISFNLKSSDGSEQEKELILEHVSFNNTELESLFILSNIEEAVVFPNPVLTTAKLYFYEENSGTYTLNLFTITGKLIQSHQLSGDSKQGQNEIEIQRNNLKSGIYFYKLESSNEKIWSGKLIIP